MYYVLYIIYYMLYIIYYILYILYIICLREILGMTTTFINRANTNEEVVRRTNLHIAANHYGTKIEPIQNILAHRRIALAAKILRQDNDSPMRMVNFKKDTSAPVEILFRRVGRPRK